MFLKKINISFSQITLILLFIFMLFSFCSCAYNTQVLHKNNQDMHEVSNLQEETPTGINKGFMEVSFLDVGQGDSIFIRLPNGQNMLIDTGNEKDGDNIIQYIRGKNVTKLDYVIATHPHADHIGSMATVLSTFDIGSFYMPKKDHTTKSYEDMMRTIQKKGLLVKTAQADVTILQEDNLSISFLAPGDLSDSDLNNVSAVIKITFGSRSFLLMGDAGIIVEQELMEKGTDIKADVIKIGNHGSNFSTSQTFLGQVSPSYAVISCGKDNSYGYPNKETLDKLQEKKVTLYRTDENGTIVMTTDGTSITTQLLAHLIQPNAANGNDSSKQSSTSKSTSAPAKTKEVYITLMGDIYHRDGCPYLSQSKMSIDLDEAIKKGYTPCKKCKP